MTNPFILKMWVKTKIRDLEKELIVCNTESEAHQIQGKLNILMEFYDDFNLEEVDEKEIVIHNKF
jgi:sulfur transfer protein SufE